MTFFAHFLLFFVVSFFSPQPLFAETYTVVSDLEGIEACEDRLTQSETLISACGAGASAHGYDESAETIQAQCDMIRAESRENTDTMKAITHCMMRLRVFGRFAAKPKEAMGVVQAVNTLEEGSRLCQFLATDDWHNYVDQVCHENRSSVKCKTEQLNEWGSCVRWQRIEPIEFIPGEKEKNPEKFQLSPIDSVARSCEKDVFDGSWTHMKYHDPSAIIRSAP